MIHTQTAFNLAHASYVSSTLSVALANLRTPTERELTSLSRVNHQHGLGVLDVLDVSMAWKEWFHAKNTRARVERALCFGLEEQRDNRHAFNTQTPLQN